MLALNHGVTGGGLLDQINAPVVATCWEIAKARETGPERLKGEVLERGSDIPAKEPAVNIGKFKFGNVHSSTFDRTESLESDTKMSLPSYQLRW